VPGDRPLPINLPTALRLADSRPIDIAVATQRIRQAAAQLDRANVLWLPTVFVGPDYIRHDGQIQDVQGNVFGTSKTSFLFGVAPYMVFALSDAIFAPLAARQVVRAREAGLQAARNDSFLAVVRSGHLPHRRAARRPQGRGGKPRRAVAAAVGTQPAARGQRLGGAGRAASWPGRTRAQVA
jgi:hypothetical protein